MSSSQVTTTKQVTLSLLRSTFGTHVYQEEENNANRQTFPTIYVKKHVFGSHHANPPSHIVVTLEFPLPTISAPTGK